MPFAVPIAWLQLKREKLRLAVALAGVAFAVVLIFMQLGFQDALFSSSVRYHGNLDYDIAINTVPLFIHEAEKILRAGVTFLGERPEIAQGRGEVPALMCGDTSIEIRPRSPGGEHDQREYQGC